MDKDTTARLLIRCPDQSGIVSAVTSFLFNHNANITALDQHSTDPTGGVLFMRLEFQTPHLDISRPVLEKSFEAVASRYSMDWTISYASEKKKTAVLVSKYDHILLDLLWRCSRDELFTDIFVVISNHADLKKSVELFNVPFYHIPNVEKIKSDAEERMLEILEEKADLIVLARYMQVLTPQFVDKFKNRIINIHHSFLPAFAGSDPYRQAYEKGVKLIGATAHYVISELDMGPIIEQDVIRVSHRNSIKELKELGSDIEKNALARAVKWHLEDKVIVYENKTVVFKNF